MDKKDKEDLKESVKEGKQIRYFKENCDRFAWRGGFDMLHDSLGIPRIKYPDEEDS